MADYISRDEFAEYLADIQYGEAPTGRTGENIDYQNGVYAGLDMAYAALKQFPAADVRSVVLCRDCKHYKESKLLGPTKFCYFYQIGTGLNTADDDFCSKGERRADND